MRKLQIIAIIIVFSPLVTASSQPEIQVENVTPQPGSPGDTVKIQLLAQNQGSTGGEYEGIGVETGSSMTLLGRTSLDDSFYLCGGCQKTGTFYIKISENAVSGSYPIKFSLTNDETGIIKNSVIEVDGKPNPIVSAEDLEVKQGGETRFNVSVSNHGTDKSMETVLSLNNNDMSFSPSKANLGQIDAGETKEVPVGLDAGEDLSNGPSEIKAEIDYRDGSENLEKQSSFSALVLKDANMVVSQIDIDESEIGSETRVMIELENTGPGEASNISSELRCDKAAVQNSRAFAGSLDSDESIPTVYSVVPESETAECNIEVSYTDSVTDVTKTSFEISSSRERVSIYYIAVISSLIAISGIYYWRKRDSK